MTNRLNPDDLPDPDDRVQADVVIYDGDCVFCRAGVRQVHRLDLGRKLAFLSLHDPRVASRYPNLSHDQLMEQMYIVDQNGTQHGGSEAVKYLSRRLLTLWLVMPILHIPGTAGLWRWGYHQVAKHRYRIAGKSCETDACAVHFGPSQVKSE
ncbi:MAG: DUF393 domain-containing protein [Planctomycetota bacterium]